MGNSANTLTGIQLASLRLNHSKAEFHSNQLGAGGRVSFGFGVTVNTNEIEGKTELINSASITLEIDVTGHSTDDEEKLFTVSITMTGAFSIDDEAEISVRAFEAEASQLAAPIYSEARAYLNHTLEKMDLRNIPVPWSLPEIELSTPE
jgi:hypothetical protein